MKIWKVLGAVLASASMALLAACSGTGSPPASASGKLTVAVAFYPFQFVAERVGGDHVAVTNLTSPGTEPHDLELTPKQVASLSTDDLVIFQSGFQPAVDEAIAQAAPKRSVDTASFLTLKKAEADDDHAANDPHTWLDPTNLITTAEHVQVALTQARPEAATEIAANTKALIGDLTALDADISADLSSCRITAFITSHAAFGYFAARYGLTQVGIRGVEPDVEPSAARIFEVQQIAKDRQVTTIFFETLVSPVVATSIAGDLGLKTDVLDPLEGITEDSRGSDYLEVMRANATALRTANECQ